MLNFRLLAATILLAAAYMAVIISSMGGDISISGLGPRPAIATAAAPRPVPPPDRRDGQAALPEPVVLPDRAVRPPPPVQRFAAQKKESADDLPNLLHVFLPLLFDREGNLRSPAVPK